MNEARFFVKHYGKEKINTLTKYPSILTYHLMGDRGILQDETTTDFRDFDTLHVSEKIDGTNARILLFSDNSFLVGSRDNLLHASGDLYYGMDNGIVDSLYELEILNRLLSNETPILVIYGEVYGGKINGAQHYGKSKTGFRAFDIVEFEKEEALLQTLALSLPEISLWREHNQGKRIAYGQPFLNKTAFHDLAELMHIETVPVTQIIGSPLDTSIEGVYQYLTRHFQKSQAVLDPNATGNAEGIVISSGDRSQIVKLRFEDYTRTLKTRKR